MPQLPIATWLYSHASPSGRLFATGENHPGPGWFDTPAKLTAPASSAAAVAPRPTPSVTWTSLDKPDPAP